MGIHREEENMTQKQHVENDSALWRNLQDSEIAFIKARMDFHAGCTDKVAVIQKALRDPVQRGTALRYLLYMKISERQQLFDELLYLASVGHADIALCREVILSLPREWVVSNIERRAEPLLGRGTDEEYRRLIELYIDIDCNLAWRLAKKALQNDDPDIREVGEDFLGIIAGDQGANDEEKQLYTENLKIYRELGDKKGIAKRG